MRRQTSHAASAARAYQGSTMTVPGRYAKAKRFQAESPFCFSSLFEHDLFRKPVSTFRDHALSLNADVEPSTLATAAILATVAVIAASAARRQRADRPGGAECRTQSAGRTSCGARTRIAQRGRPAAQNGAHAGAGARRKFI